MAFRKTLTKRLLHCFKTTSPSAYLVSSSPLRATVPPPLASKINIHHEYGNRGFFRRFVHRRPVYGPQGSPILPEFLSIPVGEKLREKLKSINKEALCSRMNSVFDGSVITVKDAKKILRTWQIEKIKVKLKSIKENSISYSQFVRICVQVCDNEDEGTVLAKIFDDSGCVIVTGNVVFLRPEKVAKALECLIFESITHPIEPRRKELEQMEKKKALIDEKAKAHVRSELYCGLGYLMVQTIGFIRLTFWELSWDVMEPICFFVTSLHFALAYIFFLRTSIEPTFEGYFHARFKSKQQKLMERYNFDIQRYNELCKVCDLICQECAKSQPLLLPFNHA
ncbi:PREDICTED: calcium uniporter protein 4, mitochondrial-like isoform X1 [Lupinus angustifolius]|uniref:calcium uniporter protein 4, mitochondrial-like isoform X1 n=1 Tax=Lupinus angustifolius TaxID=3871 RepID=UPI00092EE02F|nr:PREDICTED: calcium uniporter protein 4, mitochondrial-like isoform X1 [Lupinus angustifolius]